MEKMSASSVVPMSSSVGVQALVRRTHEDRVLQVLRAHGSLTRADLSQQIGLSRTTLSEITASLIERRIISVVASQTPPSRRGRPAEYLQLDPNAGQYVGVDIRHTLVRVVVANAARELIASATAPYDSEEGWDGRLAVAFELIDSMEREHGVRVDSVLGVAVGLPGPFSSRVPHTGDEPMAEARRIGAERVRRAFAERFNADILLDNNTRLAALAEAAWVPDRDVDHLLYLRLSYGIGGGLVVDGRLVAGSTGLAGEFGHMIVPGNTTQCRCGKRGCLETVASVQAIIDGCRAAGVAVTNLDDVADAAAKGDPLVLAVIREAGTAVGQILGSLAVALNPAEIVIAGEVAMVSDVLIAQIAEAISFELLPVGQYGPGIRRTALGDEGGAIGGIVALLHRSPLLVGYPQVAGAALPDRNRRSPS